MPKFQPRPMVDEMIEAVQVAGTDWELLGHTRRVPAAEDFRTAGGILFYARPVNWNYPYGKGYNARMHHSFALYGESLKRNLDERWQQGISDLLALIQVEYIPEWINEVPRRSLMYYVAYHPWLVEWEPGNQAWCLRPKNILQVNRYVIRCMGDEVKQRKWS